MAIDPHHPPPPPDPGQPPTAFFGNYSMGRANGLNILNAYGVSISGFASAVFQACWTVL